MIYKGEARLNSSRVPLGQPPMPLIEQRRPLAKLFWNLMMLHQEQTLEKYRTNVHFDASIVQTLQPPACHEAPVEEIERCLNQVN